MWKFSNYVFSCFSTGTSAICDPACQNGGICIAPDTCDCSGTKYMGGQCETGLKIDKFEIF